MAKVLVTGASGFIGYHLVQALAERGDEVVCLVRKTSSVERIRRFAPALAYGDVTDPAGLAEAIAGAAVVYHLAGATRALRVEQLQRINQQGVRHVARACAEQARPPVLVVVSSLAAAGPSPRGAPRTEAEPAAPVSNYGRSKRAGEVAAEEFAGRVPTTIVRPAIVFGQADKDCLELFRPVARFGIHMVPGLRTRQYSLIHATDLVRLLLVAAERGSRLPPPGTPASGAPGYYFAAADEYPTFPQLGRMIGRALGRRRTLCLRNAAPAVWCVALMGDTWGRIRRRPVVFNLDKAREALAGSWICSARKAADELGFSVAAPLADRLRETAEWYRREKWL